MKKDTKDNITIGSAMTMLLFGAGMTTAGFLVHPIGEVSNSVLTVLGECLIYAGGALGIANYVQTTVKDEVQKFKTGK